MKIREGFVSNSSSSSFVLVADKEKFLEAVKKCHPFIQHIADELVSYKKLFGRDIAYAFENESSEDYVNYNLEGYVGKVLTYDSEVDISHITYGDYQPLQRSDAIGRITEHMDKSDYIAEEEYN